MPILPEDRRFETRISGFEHTGSVWSPPLAEPTGSVYKTSLPFPRCSQPVPAVEPLPNNSFPVTPTRDLAGWAQRLGVDEFEIDYCFHLLETEPDPIPERPRRKTCEICARTFDYFDPVKGVWRRRSRSLADGVCTSCLAGRVGASGKTGIPLLDLPSGPLSDPDHHVKQHAALQAERSALGAALIRSVLTMHPDAETGEAPEALPVPSSEARSANGLVTSHKNGGEKRNCSNTPQDWKSTNDKTATIEVFQRDVRIRRNYLSAEALGVMMHGGGGEAERDNKALEVCPSSYGLGLSERSS